MKLVTFGTEIFFPVKGHIKGLFIKVLLGELFSLPNDRADGTITKTDRTFKALCHCAPNILIQKERIR